MKYKNLNIRKTFFTLGLSFFLIGCSKEEKSLEDTTIVLEEIESDVNNKNLVESTTEIMQEETIQETIEDVIEEVITESMDEEILIDPTIEYEENLYTTTELNLRENSNTESNIITVIDKCQKVAEIKNLGEWTYVEYGDNYGYVHNAYIKPLPETYIEIDISDQNIKYHIDEEIIVDSDIVTGHKGISDTRIGMFKIYAKQTSRYLTGPGYRSYVDYWMPFDGGIGLHDAQWRNEFGGEIYINSGSHGCVNLPLDVAKIIYENSEVGTKVLVHK